MEPIATLITSLDASLQDLQHLEQVMLEETRALESRNPDALHTIVTEKLSLIARLETETRRQRAWVEQEDLSFTPKGIEAFLLRVDQDHQLAQRWSQLRELSRRCNRLNKGNARLIERDRRRIHTTLQILQGEDANTTTYTPYGRAAPGLKRSRTISQA